VDIVPVVICFYVIICAIHLPTRSTMHVDLLMELQYMGSKLEDPCITFVHRRGCSAMRSNAPFDYNIAAQPARPAARVDYTVRRDVADCGSNPKPDTSAKNI